MNLFYQPLIKEGKFYLDPEESRHCVKVLRKRAGDAITVVDGKGMFYETLLTGVDSRQCHFEIVKEIPETLRNFFIHIAVAPTKNADRIEWFVEKATEVGIDRITFIQCDHSERITLRIDRIERIAVTAMKQSLKASLPLVNNPINFREFIKDQSEKEKFIAYVDSSNPHHLKYLATPSTSYCILIGPEGDFSEEELELAKDQDYKKVSLGNARLRTETAALVACHTLHLLNL